jgi:NADH:ubiquinone reductase (H+-translocating)
MATAATPVFLPSAPHVLIIGGGFGGLTAAQALAKAPVRVTIVDKTNHHTFQPLLYQVAMAGLSPAEIAQPIRAILHGQRNATVLMAKVASVDLAGRVAHLEDGSVIAWDFLIVACGAETAYFGHDDWERAAPGLKSIEDAIEIRQRVLYAFELAERETSPERKQQLTSFVVIGGGPTGVELAGALAELARYTLERDFRSVDPSLAKVRLIEAGPRILASFPEDLSQSALEQLHELGVEVRTGGRVTAMGPDAVRVGDETIPCSIVLWAAGVRGNPLTKTLGVPLDRSDRVLVDKNLTVPGHPRAFVIGDAARFDGKDGKPLPGVSPVAMQQARAVAAAIGRAVASGRETGGPPFEYVDEGSMATIGRSRAVVRVRGVHLSGFIAWLAWLVVHIWYLIGFKNRLVVMIVWAWSYLTYRRGARLITAYRPFHPLEPLVRELPVPVPAPPDPHPNGKDCFLS